VIERSFGGRRWVFAELVVVADVVVGFEQL